MPEYGLLVVVKNMAKGWQQ